MSEKTVDKKPEKDPNSAKYLLRALTAQHYEDAWTAKNNGEKIGWCASNFPQEIYTTLGIKVVYPENHAAAVSAKGGGERMCVQSENKGYSNDICAYARISLAYIEDTDIPELNMPQPDFLLCCNNICNCMIKWYENISKELNIPLIMIDIPYNPEYEAPPEQIAYVKAQFYDAIHHLEEITGKKWDEDKSNRTGRAWLKAAGYCNTEPSPLNGFDLFNHMAVACCARGTVEGAEAFEKLAEEYEEMTKTGESTYKVEQKFRVMYEGIACWPYLRHKLETLMSYGMNMVGTVYAAAFGINYDNEDGLMAAYTNVPNCMNFERALQLRVDAATKAHCEGGIIHTNRSCKLWSGIMYELDRQLQKRADMPTVTFDGDQSDPRNFSKAQYDTRVQGLYEIMKDKKENRQA